MGDQIIGVFRAAIGALGLVVGAAALAPGAHAAPSSTAAAIQASETDILPMVQVRGRPPHPHTLAEEMAIRHVPAFSIAVES